MQNHLGQPKKQVTGLFSIYEWWGAGNNFLITHTQVPSELGTFQFGILWGKKLPLYGKTLTPSPQVQPMPAQSHRAELVPQPVWG